MPLPRAGVRLDAFIDHHRERGERIPVDLCLVVAASMARHRASSVVIGLDGDVEPAESDPSSERFRAALLAMLTLDELADPIVDLGEVRPDAPDALVELVFELSAGAPPTWPELALRLEELRDEVEGSHAELARYVRLRFESERRAPDPEALLGGALDDEMVRLDLKIAQGWQAMMACCVVIAFVAATVSPMLGLYSGLLAVALGSWYAVYAAKLRRGGDVRLMAHGTTLLEGVVPWVFFYIGYRAEGAAYALSSWVAPLMTAVIILLATARLRPIAPVAIGGFGGLLLPLLYFTILRAELTPEEALKPALQASMQVTRGASLALCGLFGGVVSLALRNAIRRAERTQRQRDLFGKYRLLEPIGSGGMGTVYEARYCPEGGFERRVAVKKIHPHLASDDKLVGAFRREAELSSRLAHANIVQVLDFGQVDGSYFLAMEYVDGTTLRDIMADHQALPPRLVAHIGHEIAAGLAYAHHGARGDDGRPLRVVHRDISPANILVSRNGEVKISDFGVAKALHLAADTVTETVAGHYGYMAPEQAAGDPLDERCDLFALGVVLWELLTGQRLFFRAEQAATLLAVLHDEVPAPSSIRPELDPAWDELLSHALERDRRERFSSSQALLEALAARMVAEGGPCAGEVAALVADEA